MHPVDNKRESDFEYNGYLFWGLIAIELFMSFSFLGYIHIDPISITFVYIPVLAAGCILGPRESGIIGAVFGLVSMWKASAFYVGAGDAVFSPVMSGHPLGSILLSVGARALFGVIVGFMYRAARRSRHPMIWIIVVTSLGRTVHTLCVYSVMGVFFPEMGLTATDTLKGITRLDYIPFLVAANIIVVACYLFRRSDYLNGLLDRINRVDKIYASTSGPGRTMTVMFVFVLMASVSVALYFTNRIRTVMAEYGLDLGEYASYDIMHLQIQFLFGMLSLALLVIMIISMHQKNMNYLYHEAKKDGLTGLPGRELFFQTGKELLQNMSSDQTGRTACFFILDIDDFKQINDVYGHPTGDAVLKEATGHMKRIFGDKGILGRLGGDEFVALISRPMAKAEIEALLNELKKAISDIRIENVNVTCSIGVIPVEKEYSMESLYKNADRLLYEAKKKGKDQFVFGYRFEDPQHKK